MSDEGPRLGCSAAELEKGTEFSADEGSTWLVVRTEPRYRTHHPDCTVLRFMASPAETTGLSTWVEVELEERRHVLLEREWSAVKPGRISG